jgi:hypothetical protein
MHHYSAKTMYLKILQHKIKDMTASKDEKVACHLFPEKEKAILLKALGM